MKLKVCGMRDPENIKELSRLSIDYIGLIFYPKSARYFGNQDADILNSIPDTIKRVGVFVNENPDVVLSKIDQYKLDLVQLHGEESISYCKMLENRLPVIKAFNISETSDFLLTEKYEGACSYYLLDTKTSQHGGSGLKFDWNILKAYKSDTCFFLSGGISAEDVNLIKKVEHPKLYGLDVNSRFEISPDLKNISLLDQFIKELNHE